MSKRNILIKKKNSKGWDELYPITTAGNVKCSNGKSVESKMEHMEIEQNNMNIEINNIISNRPTDFHFYIDYENGNDENDGHNKLHPRKTLPNFSKIYPKYGTTIRVYFMSDYPNTINLSHISFGWSIIFQSINETKYKIHSVQIDSCNSCDMNYDYIKFLSLTIGPSDFSNSSIVYLYECDLISHARLKNQSYAKIEYCNFIATNGNQQQYAISVEEFSKLISFKNTSSEYYKFGLVCEGLSKIYKVSTQPTGTKSNEYTFQGGEIIQ